MTAARTKPSKVRTRPHLESHFATLVVDNMSLHIPDTVTDLPSFRNWIHSEAIPEKGPRICFFHGQVWVDVSKEQIFSHNQVKNEFAFTLTALAKKKHGKYFPDGVLVTNVQVGLAAVPDGVFVSDQCLASGKVRLVEGRSGGYVELEGSPDMVLEVVSLSSVKKDLEILFPLYWQAAIPEYWLVDVREDKLDFDIYQHSREGYVAVPPKGGWIASKVFGKAFRLSRHIDRRGYLEYALEVR